MVPPTRTARVKVFIDILSRKMSTKTFATFLTALQYYPDLKLDIVRAYESEGGRLGIKNAFDDVHKDCLCHECMERAKRRQLLIVQ